MLLYIDDFREMPHDYSDRINNLELISSFFFFLKEENKSCQSVERLEFKTVIVRFLEKKKKKKLHWNARSCVKICERIIAN